MLPILLVGVILLSVGLGVGFVALESLLSRVNAVSDGDSVPVAVELVALSGNVAVSLGIAYLYLQLRDIQLRQAQTENTQANLQERQTKLMELERSPRLFLEEFTVGESPPSADDASGFEVVLVNAGGGPAANLTARTVLEVDSQTVTGGEASSEVLLASDNTLGVGQNYLRSDSGPERFCTRPLAEVETSEGEYGGPLEDVLSEHVECGTDVRIRLFIETDNITNNIKSCRILDHVVNSINDVTLGYIVDEGTPTELATWPASEQGQRVER